MSVRHPSRLYLIVLWLSLVAVLLAGCPPATPAPPATEQPTVPATAVPTSPATEEPATPTVSPPTPEPPAEEPPEQGPVEDFGCEWFREPEPAATGSHTVLDQVILTGPRSRFADFTDQLTAKGIELTLLKSCDLGYLKQSPALDEGFAEAAAKYADEINQPLEPLPFTPEDLAELQSRLYQIDGAPGDYYSTIAELAALGKEAGVYADPNYLVGPLYAGPCSDPSVAGNPFTVGGSPFTVGGSPFTVGGSPHAGPGAVANPTIFWRQWALRRLGVKPPGVAANLGKGTVVGVFDTSPFDPSTSTPQQIGLIKPPMTLHLSFPPMSTVLMPVTPTVNVSDHGLFAAGLVYGVAPGSEIRLIRVLNEYGCGDLDTLNTAIHEFNYTRQNEEGAEGLADVVLNLSLGVQQPVDLELEKEKWPKDIVSLNAAMQHAVAMGAVVVSAAGNETQPPDPPMPMQLPGWFPIVIGVAASNIEDQAACYTNVGDVGAPGADGHLPGESTCEPRAIECSDTDADCPLGVISLGRDAAGGYFYQFWVGSSFAAPLVSGQAAVLRSNTSGESPFDIMDTIYNNAVPVTPTPNPFIHGLSVSP